jgi:hypothetical protein
LVSGLEKAGIDVGAAGRDGRYIMLDADETLSTFMLGGSPDAARFSARVGKVLEDSRARAKSKDQGLTVFGEMVSILWDGGQKEAACLLKASGILRPPATRSTCTAPILGRYSPIKSSYGPSAKFILTSRSSVLLVPLVRSVSCRC